LFIDSLYDSKGFWGKRSNQLAYLKWLAAQLRIDESNPEHWYSVTTHDFEDNSGSKLLKAFDDSLYKLLTTVYPSAKWQPWRFKTAPHGIWSDRDMQKKFLDWLAAELNLKSLEDWYAVKIRTIIALGGERLLDKYQLNLCALLNDIYSGFVPIFLVSPLY